MPGESSTLSSALRKYFGFETFRPLQEDIIRDSLDGKDVFALLPTGGGKSLCFQLPAILREGLTLVVSPLIALMKDQVDALTASGVPATFINSSLEPGEAARRIQGLHNHEYKLLYVAPERLMTPGFFEDLERWKIELIAIDEAHCISEWGHDFRPDYRQIATLRNRFPELPVLALTATATERVRKDIVHQLRLREPSVYVASFNRENLNYAVLPKSGATGQIIDFIKKRDGESGIVYCQSRKATETMASALRSSGIDAVHYHAGMEKGERERSQEAFIRDEVPVVCATIAFGMGINKPNVRFVIHHDIPKNIESYYQETGRAGRDGLPSDCLLLFSAGDRMKHMRFIDEKEDENEKAVARDQLEKMVHYAESARCRRVDLLEYFGEAYEQENCEACDNCLTPRETWDATTSAKKFLACVFRVRQMSGFDVGINHIVEILTGANTEKIRKFSHTELSTYGIGDELDRREWAALGRDMVRLGYLSQDPERFNTLSLSAEGMAFLKDEEVELELAKALVLDEEKPQHRAGEIECDEKLFGVLRRLRKELADEKGVPPYVVFSDVSLRQMAARYPEGESQFATVQGVGEQKLREYGRTFTDTISAYLSENPKLVFDTVPSRVGVTKPKPRKQGKSASMLQTIELFRSGLSPEDIAGRRRMAISTVVGHITAGIEHGEMLDTSSVLTDEARAEITEVFREKGCAHLGPVKEALDDRFSWEQLKICRALFRAEPEE